MKGMTNEATQDSDEKEEEATQDSDNNEEGATVSRY